MSELLRTPLFTQHQNLKARIVPFAGYQMPVQYAGVLEEAKQVRTHAGLFDVSHMGQLRVRGKGALEAVNALLTNDLSKTQLGQAQYSLVCNPEGGIIDDVIAYHRGPEEIFICVNASNRAAVFAWFQQHLKGASLEDLSDSLSLLAVQGPRAEEILSECSDPQVAKNLKYYWAAESKVFGEPCYLSRTGYTGEDGFEIYVRNEAAPRIWQSLMELGAPKGLAPIGLGARDTLRLEMGYPLHGHEISTEISPFEAGLNWVVKLKKAGGFMGQPTLQKLFEAGPRKVLRGFAVEDRRMARQGAEIYTPAKVKVGTVTSGTFSPHLHHPIALGFVDASQADAKDFLLKVREELVPMHTRPLPFVPSQAKKK
ncbi:glycine cleavage system aminomethyltransferase GcvT [bacterium]|nr:glycine cleavage system aminomethyltransferase GcvT [bacterium]